MKHNWINRLLCLVLCFDLLLGNLPAAALAEELGCKSGDNQTVVSTCDRVFLAVKPQMMAEALMPLRKSLREQKPLLITMAAGIEIAKIQELAGTELPVIRIMPNTPTAIGKGVIQYCCNASVDAAETTDWLADMDPCGLLDELEETTLTISTIDA